AAHAERGGSSEERGPSLHPPTSRPAAERVDGALVRVNITCAGTGRLTCVTSSLHGQACLRRRSHRAAGRPEAREPWFSTYIIRCSLCPPAVAPILRNVGTIGQDEEAVLQQHLRAAHPQEQLAAGLGELLRHFNVERTPTSS